MTKTKSTRVLIGEAIISMGLRRVKSHELQGMVVDWIRRNYRSVNPETVQRKWRKMIESGDVEVEVSKDGPQNVYKILRVGDITITHPPKQGTLF